jgi:two-component system phosphate regulon sensor histidine kinase PhoR
MNRKVILIIVVLSAISLLGIVLTQLYWVQKSMNLAEEQFDNSVRISLKSVLNRLLENKNDTIFQQQLYDLSCRKPRLDLTDYITPYMLDSLMYEEISFMELGENYYYGIYNKNNSRFVTGNYAGFEEAVMESPFQFSVSSIYKPGDYYLSVHFPTKTSVLLRKMEVWLLLSVFFLIVLMISFVYVIFAILRQKRLTEIKTDFINNLTHEFKTPIATSILAGEMLIKPEVQENSARIKKYAKVVLDENQRLQGHVEQVLRIATLETGNERLKFKKIDIHDILKSVVDSFELRLRENKVDIEVDLDAGEPQIVADKSHIGNVFYNLMDNAIKYSSENPVVQLKTWNDKNGIFVRIKDNGIGIDFPHQKNIFKSLYRVPTGNIHEVRGFGLGLYYAKSVVDYHHGMIQLESEPGRGSSFDVYLPFNIK